MSLLKFLFILVLILFPFGELFRFDIGNNIVIKPLDGLVLLCVICWLFVRRKNNTYSFWPFLLFPLVGLVSLFINTTWLHANQFLASILYLFRWVSYVALVFVILQFDKNFKRKIAIMLFFDGLVILIFGYIQYFFYNSLGNLYYLGWDAHMHRIFSTFFDPNFTGAFYGLYGIFLAGGIQQLLARKQKRNAMLLGIVLLFTLIALFLTFSRSAILMLIVGSIVFLTLIKKKKLALLVFGAILLFGILASPKFYDENMNLFRIRSSEARIGNYEVALRVIHDRPILGVGFNSYRYTKNLYGLDHDWVNAPSHADAGVDNSFLFVLATTGIIGFAAYVWLWTSIIKKSFAVHKKNFAIGSVVVISSAFALFTSALFINSLFYVPLLLWMWVIVAIAEDV